jgi:hypothetical protein
MFKTQVLQHAHSELSTPCEISESVLQFFLEWWETTALTHALARFDQITVHALSGGPVKRFRTKRCEPGLVLLQARLRPSDKAALARKAHGSGVSLAEYVRVMTGLELEESNPYSASAFLRMRAVEDRELERRERARV